MFQNKLYKYQLKVDKKHKEKKLLLNDIPIKARYDYWIKYFANDYYEHIKQLTDNPTIMRKTNSRIEFVVWIWNYLKKTENATIQQALKAHAKSVQLNSSKQRVSIKRSVFYKMQKDIFKILNFKLPLKQRKNLLIDKITTKSTAPKRVRRKYSDEQLKKIATGYDWLMRDNGTSLQDYRHLINSNRVVILNEIQDFKEILPVSEKTIVKALKLHSELKTFQQKHFRNVKLKSSLLNSLGMLQLDVKHITRKMTASRQKYYIIDMIDEASKIYFGRIVRNATSKEILKTLEDGKTYYENLGITIKRIRTDHCNIFKATAFVNEKEFQIFLTDNNIRHQYIYFQQPEYNGSIERMHQVINEELRIPFLYRGKNLQALEEIYAQFIGRHNFSRTRTYSWREGSKTYRFHEIPITRLEELKKIQELVMENEDKNDESKTNENKG